MDTGDTVDLGTIRVLVLPESAMSLALKRELDLGDSDISANGFVVVWRLEDEEGALPVMRIYVGDEFKGMRSDVSEYLEVRPAELTLPFAAYHVGMELHEMFHEKVLSEKDYKSSMGFVHSVVRYSPSFTSRQRRLFDALFSFTAGCEDWLETVEDVGSAGVLIVELLRKKPFPEWRAVEPGSDTG